MTPKPSSSSKFDVVERYSRTLDQARINSGWRDPHRVSRTIARLGTYAIAAAGLVIGATIVRRLT